MTRRRLGWALAVLAATLGLLVALELAYERTDVFRRGNRVYYRDGRATQAGIAFGRFWTLLSRFGLTPPFIVSLETIGSRSGRRRAVPMVIARYESHDYLVAMLGERSPWVHNVRAAGGQAWLRRGRVRAAHLVEVPVSDRAPIIRAYLRVAAGARPHIRVATDAPIEAFEAVAGAHPVFRIDAA
ncbi:MAG TPA: nitroreductase/quinone reductase family protein [Candidatus Limnocylindrales bacterium]|nr:nitroreductase/quinone reductase family protein [Candidatus Limnocylindrales bacterium]